MEGLGIGSMGVLVVFGVDPPGFLVGVGVLFCGVGWAGLSMFCTPCINKRYTTIWRWLTKFLGWKYGQFEPLHSPRSYFAHTGFLEGAKVIMSR